MLNNESFLYAILLVNSGNISCTVKEEKINLNADY